MGAWQKPLNWRTVGAARMALGLKPLCLPMKATRGERPVHPLLGSPQKRKNCEPPPERPVGRFWGRVDPDLRDLKVELSCKASPRCGRRNEERERERESDSASGAQRGDLLELGRRNRSK